MRQTLDKRTRTKKEVIIWKGPLQAERGAGKGPKKQPKGQHPGLLVNKFYNVIWP